MKNLTLLLVFPMLLLSCGNESNSSQKEQPVSIKEQFVPIINGTWVATDYLEEVAKTKSPKAAFAKAEGLVAMEINTAEILSDSLTVAGSWNNHEGYLYTIYFKQGQDGKSLVTTHTYNDYGTDFYELSYKLVNNTDTQLLFKRYSADKKLKEERSYVKVTGPLTADSEPYGLQYMVNKTLFSGKYTAIDANGATSEIELTDDGMVKGFGTHKIYYVYTDFMDGDFTNMDEMSFDAFTKEQKPYIFELSGDTLKLYQALQNEERTQLIRGPYKYSLVRKK